MIDDNSVTHLLLVWYLWKIINFSLFLIRKYSIERRTVSLNIPYFVKDNFHTEYQGSLGRLEASVEEEYVTTLKHACYRERNYSKCNENYFDYSFNKFMSG